MIDRFTSENNTFSFPVCNKCLHNKGNKKCLAFPDGIPDEILIGKNNHSKPLLIQSNDIVFKPKQKAVK